MEHAPTPILRHVPRQRIYYAHLLRQFAAGRITNMQYMRQADDLLSAFRTDDTLWRVYESVWGYFCDGRTHTLAGDWALDADARSQIARCILLLRSGHNAQLVAFWKWHSTVANGLWLFINEQDFQAAKRQQIYLYGKPAAA